MASLDFLQLVTERLEIVLVGIEDGAVQIELDDGLRLADRGDLALIIAFWSLVAVTSVAYLTTLNGLPFKSKMGL